MVGVALPLVITVASVEMLGLAVAVVQSLCYLNGELEEGSGSADGSENTKP
jgi:hypothetical protein